MRQDWDERARRNVFFYIASWRRDWDERSFLMSGEEDYRRLVQTVLERWDFAEPGKTMLELGCGAGRMTGAFARRFDRVVAFDISPEMLDCARRSHAGAASITWQLGNGTDLSAVPSASAHFVFSYLVLQHLPDERLVHAYIAEMMRVLSEGGLCLFQFNGSRDPHMNWKGRMAWGVIDLLWSARLRRASRRAARLLGFDPGMAGKTWHGVAVPADRICTTVRQNGGEVLELRNETSAFAWCCARKTFES